MNKWQQPVCRHEGNTKAQRIQNPKENDEINKKTVAIVEKDSVNLSDEDEGENIANLEKM